MRLSTTRIFPLALMVSLAALTFWLDHAVRVAEPRETPLRHDPDYIVSDFTVTTYGRDGTAKSELSAAKMVHYPDDDSTQLVSPVVVQKKPGQARMTVRADRGTLSSNGEEIFLYDNVVLTRDQDGGRPAARMTTSYLQIAREHSIARTDREVTIVEDNRMLRGRGMLYDNDDLHLDLYADVHGRYEPETP